MLLALQAIFFLFQVCFADGSNDNNTSPSCPEQLICTFPKTKILLKDPLHPGCQKTVCACKGTNNRITSQSLYRQQYQNTEIRYTNCTLVEGNLELVGFESHVSKVDFTKHIEQVTGYVLITRVNARYIDLSSLRLIRGIEKYVPEKSGDQNNCKGTAGLSNPTISSDNSVSEEEGYSLYVSNNAEKASVRNRQGLRQLWLPSLTEISAGNVAFQNNPLLCHVDSISWDRELFEDSSKQKVNISNPISTPVCPECPSNCSDGFKNRCWGDTDDLCQLITRADCGFCSEKNQRCNQQSEGSQCCSAECAAGCFGQGADKCHACKGMNDDGTCRERCPYKRTLNPGTGKFEYPEKRYQLARYCVKDCPANVPQTDIYCKPFCPKGTFDFANNNCTTCDGGKCDHICDGLGTNQGPLANDDSIHANNIKYFNKNCTIIEGNLYFRKASFQGDSYCRLGSLTEKDFEVFSNVREITGNLAIEDWPFQDLCIFKNLRRIRGKMLKNQRYGLFVFSGKSNLRDLCLNSLQSIDNGAVYIVGNKFLCVATSIDWSHYTNDLIPTVVSGNNEHCARCHRQCNATEGCWGSQEEQCVQCENYKDNTQSNGLFTPNYVTDSTTGLIHPGNNVTTCVGKCKFTKGVYASEDKQCLPCHPECNLCTGPGPANCRRCRNAKFNGTCVRSCSQSQYMGFNATCMPCAKGCTDGGCNGSLPEYNPESGCKSCYHYIDEETNTYMYLGRKCSVCSADNLGKECPDGCSSVNNSGAYECYHIPGPNYALIFSLVGIVVAIIVVIVAWKLYRHTTTIKRMRRAIGETMVGEHNTDDEEMPLTPSGTAPNQAQLRIVKDSELAIGVLLGSGAFGEVHKAVWTPLNIQGEKVKIAVAVKTLKTPEEMTQAANNEIMDEAYMMAYVDCRYLVRLLGIRMTEHVSLITQLMPLGSLLEYVRNEKTQETIHSRQMLNWFLQIARGMLYLEEKHLVHRDLAARNVLVKTPNHVKITDFGLAKMLDVKEDTYQAEGGKLPIKWLAIECITERKFSHLSDVWAYGVTCWELLTYGARPYEGVRAVEILSLLERGERLPQPPTATIDIYMLLVKCWMVDRMCRPPFSELVSEFSRMVTDPKRYVVMKDDPSHCLLSPNPTDEDRFFRQLLEDEKIDDAIMADEPDQYLLRPENNGQPMYANQAAVTSLQNSHPPTSGPERLFSRSTPSANVDPQVASSTSTDRPRDNEMDTMLRGNSNFDQDDVFADTGSAAKSFNRNDLLAESNNRKDSEETQRYTEDPTNPRTNHLKKHSQQDGERSQMYDEEQYLLPAPNKAPVYLDPEGDLHPTVDQSVSLINDTYVDSPPSSGVPSQSPEQDYGHLASYLTQPENDYVNTAGEENHNHPTVFANEEYMATDSGIGEDSQSLLSRGNTGNRGQRKESSRSSGGDNQRYNDPNIQFRPNQTPQNGLPGHGDKLLSTSSDGSSASRSPKTALNNPEYMFLNTTSSNNTTQSERTSPNEKV